MRTSLFSTLVVFTLLTFWCPTLATAQTRSATEDLVLSRGSTPCEERAKVLGERMEHLTGNRTLETRCSPASDFDRIQIRFEPRKAFPKVNFVWGSGIGQNVGSFTSGVFETLEECSLALPELDQKATENAGVELFVSSCNPGTYEGYVAWQRFLKTPKVRLFTQELRDLTWAEDFVLEQLGPTARKVGAKDVFYFGTESKPFRPTTFFSSRSRPQCESEARVLNSQLDQMQGLGPRITECAEESLGSGLPNTYSLRMVLQDHLMILQDFLADGFKYQDLESCDADRNWQLERRRERNPQTLAALCVPASNNRQIEMRFFSTL